MSYFPTDIPFMSEEELKANGIKVNCFMSEGELKANGAKINCSEKPNNSKLRRCPFCGKEAKVGICGYAARDAATTYGVEKFFVATYKVGCFDCDITFAYESKFEAKKDGGIEVIIDGYKMAAEKWNGRNEE